MPLPAGRSAIGSKWIFKKKLNADGQVERFKARFVAQGFTQRPGVDFDETYAPVMTTTTMRTLLSIGASKGWIIEMDDVNTAYLNGKIDKEIYIRQLRGFEQAPRGQQDLSAA